jgi:chromate transporter
MNNDDRLIQHETVDVRHWLSAREFIDLFAIARAAPGPGSMLTTLIGWQVDGFIGALVATLALFVPSSLLCYAVAHVWRRHRGKRWHTALEQGLAPVGIGLVLAGAVAVLRIGSGGVLSWAIALGSAGMLSWKPKVHPLLMFVVGGAIFVLARMLAAHSASAL